MSADTMIYCSTMLMCSGIIGIALIVFGAILPMPLPQPVAIHMPRQKEVLMRGNIDRTGRLAVVNGVKIILREIEKPRRPLVLVFAD
jgi:hypothetical protein